MNGAEPFICEQLNWVLNTSSNRTSQEIEVLVACLASTSRWISPITLLQIRVNLGGRLRRVILMRSGARSGTALLDLHSLQSFWPRPSTHVCFCSCEYAVRQEGPPAPESWLRDAHAFETLPPSNETWRKRVQCCFRQLEEISQK
eukprot:5194495-Pleurochrysis_carterae.AAC.2